MKKMLSFAGVLSLAAVAWANRATPEPPGTAAQLLVTLEPKHGKEIPPIETSDITVSEGKERSRVLSMVPAGENGKTTQLLLLIDDSASSSFDTELPTLKKFIASLPESFEIAIGYMRNGTNQMAQQFTRDHQAAANSLRLALGPGGADVSPYDSLSEAVKGWPTGAERREVLMISSGVEGLGGGFTSDNPYVNHGISDAQRAGVVVYTIYTPGFGHAGHSFWRGTWGQNFLSQLSDETGGDSFMLGLGSPVSFQPYLDEFAERLQHQYILTFEVKAKSKSGLQPVSVKVTEKNASIAAADKVFVRAGK